MWVRSYRIRTHRYTHLCLAECRRKCSEVLDPESPAPILLQRTNKKLNCFNIQASNIQRILAKINANKATGPVGVSTHLRTCAAEIASPRTPILTECFSKTSRPSIWKSTKIVPVHKKDSTSKPNNYRPIPLLLAIENVFGERIIQKMCEHLENNILLSYRHYGFTTLP
nr:uncharacterized protein LOC113799990 [Penaeus vannamei]